MNLYSWLDGRPKLFHNNASGFKPDNNLSLPKKFWEKFLLEFQVYLYIVYIFTSPSAEKGEVCSFRETISP